ncbi:unnamed protein product [Prorocentrum cordatum]|uniref:Pentacotripeptide-repeat region of PRORP domain-containing protein n=1 Tax=Prorocentrum cordatum TaxID=2364126 RepID=A0ABN9TUP8_9DINO|nr:unnamed protein product [Polarella glacialis]
MARADLAPDVVAYTSLLEAAVHRGEHEAVLGEMRAARVSPNVVTYGVLMKTSATSGDFRSAEAWVRRMRAERVQPSSVTLTTLISAYAKAGLMAKAEACFRSMTLAALAPDARSYGALLDGHGGRGAEAGDPSRCEAWLARMRRGGVEPSEIQYNQLLRAQSALDRPERRPKVAACLQDMLARRVEPTAATLSVARSLLGEAEAVSLCRELGVDYHRIAVEPYDRRRHKRTASPSCGAWRLRRRVR